MDRSTITRARQSRLVKLLADGPTVEILAEYVPSAGGVVALRPQHAQSGASIRRQCAEYENSASMAGPAALGKGLEDVEQATGVGSGPVETRA